MFLSKYYSSNPFHKYHFHPIFSNVSPFLLATDIHIIKKHKRWVNHWTTLCHVYTALLPQLLKTRSIKVTPSCTTNTEKKLVLKNASFCWLLYLLCCVNYYALFVKKTGISLSWLELIKYNVLWVQKEEIRKENFISWMTFFLSACLLESVHLILPLFPVDFTFKKSFLLQNSLCFTTTVESTRHHIKLIYFLEKWVLSGWVSERVILKKNS